MATKKVVYDLKDSPFAVTIGRITYKFSSSLHKSKFIERIVSNREYYHNSILYRFKLKTNVTTWADILLYSKIETRGFLILVDGRECKWQNLELNGAIRILNN